jgi:hypothetical protein
VDLLEVKKSTDPEKNDRVPPVKLDPHCYHTIPKTNEKALTTNSSFERVKRVIKEYIYLSEKTDAMNWDIDEETIPTGGFFVRKARKRIGGNRRCANLEPVNPEKWHDIVLSVGEDKDEYDVKSPLIFDMAVIVCRINGVANVESDQRSQQTFTSQEVDDFPDYVRFEFYPPVAGDKVSTATPVAGKPVEFDLLVTVSKRTCLWLSYCSYFVSNFFLLYAVNRMTIIAWRTPMTSTVTMRLTIACT